MIRSMLRFIVLVAVYSTLLSLELLLLTPNGFAYWLPDMTFVLTLFTALFVKGSCILLVLTTLLLLRLSFGLDGAASQIWSVAGLGYGIYQVRAQLFVAYSSTVWFLGLISALGCWILFAVASRFGFATPRGGDLGWISVGLTMAVVASPIVHGLLRGSRLLSWFLEEESRR